MDNRCKVSRVTRIIKNVSHREYYKGVNEMRIDRQTQDRRKRRTAQVIDRIARLKIDSYGLDCTTDEYLEECKRRNMNR